MFGFQGGETSAIVARKRGYMKDAQKRWPFLTNFDASMIKSPLQLALLIKDRTSCPRSEAEADVADWAIGKEL